MRHLLIVLVLASGQSLYASLVSALTHGNPNGVDLTFSIPIDPSAALQADNYRLSNGVARITIKSVTQIDAQTVRLEAPLPEGTVYSVTVRIQATATPSVNSTDPSLVSVDPNTILFLQVHGWIWREVWFDVGVHDLFKPIFNQKFSAYTNDFPFIQGTPDSSDFQPRCESPQSTGSDPNNGRDNYGARLRGYLVPPVTGEYLFYIQSDNQGAFSISSDDNPSNLRQVASELFFSGSSGPFCYSGPILLQAGKKYYIEAVFRDDSGGDYLRVYWQRPGDRPPTIVDGTFRDFLYKPIDGRYISAFGYSLAPVTITTQPQDQLVSPSSATSFSASVDGSPVFGFQWYRDGVALSGETKSTLTLSSVTVADHGAMFSVQVTNAFSGIESRRARLAVRGAVKDVMLEIHPVDGSHVSVSWTPEARGYLLQLHDDNFEPDRWNNVQDSVTRTNIVLLIDSPRRFFRLVQF